MTPGEVRKVLKKSPFEAFEIVLVDGRVFPVKHPEFAWMPPGNGTWFYVADDSGLQEIVNTAVISSIRPTKRSRGSQRRKSA